MKNLVKNLIILTFVFGTQAFAKAKVEKKSTDSGSSELALQVVKLTGSEGKDIVEVASGSKDHSTLVKAVVAAGLVDTLTGPGPYTIFAPTNAAFDKLPKGTVETLLKPENQLKLKSILEHHAAAPAYHPHILAGMKDVDMVDGPKLKVEVKDKKVFVDGVEVKMGIAAKNGIIYVVDTVLLAK